MNESTQYKEFIASGGIVKRIQTKPDPIIKSKNILNKASREGLKDIENKKQQHKWGSHR